MKENFTYWTGGNEKIDNLIQRMQLRVDYNNIVFEWMPYIYSFSEIKKLGKDGLYSAIIWKDGPLHYDDDAEDASDDNDVLKIYGISQDINMKNYIMVLSDGYCKKCCEVYTNTEYEWCKSCYLRDVFTNTSSGNEKVDALIREVQLKIIIYGI